MLFVEPGLQKNVFMWSRLPRPSAPHVVYAPHLYDPSMESGEPWNGAMDYFVNRVAQDRLDLDRKVLADIAVRDPKAFTELVELAKNAG